MMRITVELLASFQEGRFDTESLEFPTRARVRDVAAVLRLAEAEHGLILINNHQGGMDQLLLDGDTLTMMPMLDGG